MAGRSFREIELKFVVGASFDRGAFQARVRELGPERLARVDVRDTYYLLRDRPDHVFRHRYDEERQELTVKSLGADAVIRLEVNLDLGHHRGDQGAAVAAFLATLGVRWRGVVHKRIEVAYLADCEIVLYEAESDGRRLTCVELEATVTDDEAAALALLDARAHRLGLDPGRREKRALLELLHPEVFAGEGDVRPCASPTSPP